VASHYDAAFGVTVNTPDPGLIVVAAGSFDLTLSEAFTIDLRRHRLTRDLQFHVL
jgi:hypothetical protein